MQFTNMEKSNHYLLTPSGPLYKETVITKAIQTDQSFAFCRKLNLEDSVSTPPSELRREIFSLRNELLEAYEFHDLELTVLTEENIFKDVEFKVNKHVTELKKSLEDAEKHIDDANKEITQLKLTNQDLNKKLKDESNQNVILKQQYEDKVAKLLQNLEEKKHEIQILENDKNDSMFKIENLREIYDRKINELQLALDSANEKITKIESEKYICDTLKQRLSEEKERVNEVSKELGDKKIELTLCEQEIITCEEENEAGEEDSCHTNKNFSSVKNVSLQNGLTDNESHKEHSQEKNLLCAKELETLQIEVNNVSQKLQHRNENFIGTNLSVCKELEEASKIVKGQKEKIENLNNIKKLNNNNGNSTHDLINFTSENIMSHILDEKSFETDNEEKYISNIFSSDKTKQIEEIVPKINKDVMKNDISKHDDKELTVQMNPNNEIITVDAYFNEIVKTNSSKVSTQNSITEKNARHDDEDTLNFICEIHTLDEKKMQLNINSESKMSEFINEFARILLKNNIIDLNELKTCSNIFYFLLNKYLALVQLNSHLKTKFGIYRLSEQKECYNIMVHCLDNLCSQLEESSNLSDSSLVFFKDCPASSTMMDFSEVEISVVNDTTLKVNDPLALTNEISYQTPLKNVLKSSTKNTSFDFKTPLRSVSKRLRMPSKTPSYNTKKQLFDEPNGKKIDKGSAEIHLVQSLNSLAENEKGMFESNIDSDKKLLDAETMDSTMEAFSLLEERYMKLENIFTTFQTEKEKLTKENERLQELLLKKTKEVEDVKEKLIIEIISLNSELQGTFSDVLATDILSVFINTVRESCYKIPEILSQKSFIEIEELKVKVNAYETKIQESDKTIEKLHDLAEALKIEKEALVKDISDRDEEIKTLQLEALDIQSLKLKIENLEAKIREKDAILETETFSRKNIAKDLEKLKIIYENVESENIVLNKTKEELEKNITNINVELKTAKERLLNFEIREEELTKEIERLRSAFAEAEEKNNKLQEIIEKHEADIISVKNIKDQKIFEIKLLNEKLMEIKNYLHEKEQIISEMSCTISNAKMAKRQPKDKTIRKLEKSKELNESLAELVIKMLSLTAYENLQQMNLITSSGFLNERKQILSHFENWIHSKKKEVQELKEHIKELDEECESYAKEIKEAKKETVKIWEEGQANMNTLKSQIAQTQEEYKSLKSEKEKLQEKISYFKSDTLKMDINEGTAYEKVEMHRQENERTTHIKLKCSSVLTETANELEKLSEENTALQLHILDLEKEIAQSKEEVKKLDEECEYYAKVITESQKETVKIWEEGKVEINKLKSQIEVLQQENNNLKIEKENGFKKYENCDSKTKSYNEIENEEAEFVSCNCKKKANELKSGILLKEMKIVQSEQPLEENILQLWIVHLENSLAHLKKQFAEEKDKNKRLQEKLNEFYNGKGKNVLSENVLLENLENKNFLEPNTVQQIEDKEWIQKLKKDNKMLKELCRTRYNEIKKLEKENLSLKGQERIKK